jgi:hypothetical protein
MELRCRLLELEECLRSWGNSTSLCAHTQRRIQVQHAVVHALTDLVSSGLIWCWKHCVALGEAEGHAGDCGVTTGELRGDADPIWDLVRAP